MLDALGPLVNRVSQIAAAVRGAPHFEWGTVVTSSPLTVQLDGDTDPLLGTPAKTVANLGAGERVLVMIQNRRATVMGRGGDLVNKRGRMYVSTGTLTEIASTDIFAATISFNVPVVAPPGCAIRVSPIGIGTGWGNVSQVTQTPGVSSTTVVIRFTQISNSTPQSLALEWEVIPAS